MSETEKDVSVSFANDAEELSQETVSHLFDRFYIQDDSRNQGGTGLGLTVAKILAEEMGGTLEARLNEASSGPVSYTHLDVYKRQFLRCPPAAMNLIMRDLC